VPREAVLHEDSHLLAAAVAEAAVPVSLAEIDSHLRLLLAVFQLPFGRLPPLALLRRVVLAWHCLVLLKLKRLMLQRADLEQVDR